MSEKRESRFDLSAIEQQKTRIEQAIIEAKKPADHASGRLVALTNLPWLIVIVAWGWWYFSQH